MQHAIASRLSAREHFLAAVLSILVASAICQNWPGTGSVWLNCRQRNIANLGNLANSATMKSENRPAVQTVSGQLLLQNSRVGAGSWVKLQKFCKMFGAMLILFTFR